jgi:hypothetical protein
VILDRSDYPKELRHDVVVGVFVGGCVKRGEGSRFRSKAHTHIKGEFKGWMCVLSAKRLSARELLLHELAHLISGSGQMETRRPGDRRNARRSSRTPSQLSQENTRTHMKNELTLTQAANELGVTRQSVFIAIKRGRLNAGHREIPPFGSVLFIRRSDFETWKSESQIRRSSQKKGHTK